MNSISAALLMFLLVSSQAQAQDFNPAEGATGMKMDAPQAKPAQPAPELCMEDMPGMQMCPKAAPASAGSKDKDEMPGMQMDAGMKELMDNMNPHTFLQQIQHHASAGTSAEPNSTPTPMLMTMKGKWMLMFHANAFVTETQQTSLRGGDKFYSTNWFMPMAQRKLGSGQLTLRAMFSRSLFCRSLYAPETLRF